MRWANHPWQLTFSYGRALQDAALSAWGGKAAGVAAGQREFGKWARLNGLARSGRFKRGWKRRPPDGFNPGGRGRDRGAVMLRYAIDGRSIFDGLNLAARRGQITAVMGPSGTGKTTLLRLLMGAIRPDAGRISVFGEEVAQLRRPALYSLRRRIGMLFQNGALMSDLSRVRKRGVSAARAHPPA